MNEGGGIRKETGEMIQIGLRQCGVKHPELGLLSSRKTSGDFRKVPWKQCAVGDRVR